MQLNYELSPELAAIEEELDDIRQILNEKKYGSYPQDTRAARGEFLSIISRISKCHETLLQKINEGIPDGFVPLESAFKRGLGGYAHSLESLIMLLHLMDRYKKAGNSDVE